MHHVNASSLQLCIGEVCAGSTLAHAKCNISGGICPWGKTLTLVPSVLTKMNAELQSPMLNAVANAPHLCIAVVVPKAWLQMHSALPVLYRKHACRCIMHCQCCTTSLQMHSVSFSRILTHHVETITMFCSAIHSHTGNMHAFPNKHGCILVPGALWVWKSLHSVCNSLESGMYSNHDKLSELLMTEAA